MAAQITAADLILADCDCGPVNWRLPDGTAAEWYPTPKAAALAVRRHVEAAHVYWAVHYTPSDPHAPIVGNAHVVSARVDGQWWGPGRPR